MTRSSGAVAVAVVVATRNRAGVAEAVLALPWVVRERRPSWRPRCAR